MSAIDHLDHLIPELGAGSGGGGRARRILVPAATPGEGVAAIDAAARLFADGAELRLLHVRMYDPPMPRCPTRLFLETARQAEAVLDDTLPAAWAAGLVVSTALVEAQRCDVARAIAVQARGWGAAAIVLTRRPRRPISVLLGGSVAERVMREASCPVLAVHPPAARRLSFGRLSRHVSH
jgi:nucleotide-binding universal stress UspA family protein